MILWSSKCCFCCSSKGIFCQGIFTKAYCGKLLVPDKWSRSCSKRAWPPKCYHFKTLRRNATDLFLTHFCRFGYKRHHGSTICKRKKPTNWGVHDHADHHTYDSWLSRGSLTSRIVFRNSLDLRLFDPDLATNSAGWLGNKAMKIGSTSGNMFQVIDRQVSQAKIAKNGSLQDCYPFDMAYFEVKLVVFIGFQPPKWWQFFQLRGGWLKPTSGCSFNHYFIAGAFHFILSTICRVWYGRFSTIV